jgi:uncharacterized protein YggE
MRLNAISRSKPSPRAVRYLAPLCVAVAAASAGAQPSPAGDEPKIAVTGVGRVLVAPDRATISLGATIERNEARAAQRDLDAVMREAVRSIRSLGLAAENLQTASLSLTPVYADPTVRDGADDLARRRQGPRIVGYRASNILDVTLEDLTMVGAVVDAGIAAGVNEIRNVSFGLADELPFRVTALERAVEVARRKALAAANALGVRLGQPLEVRESSVSVPFGQVAFARAEAGPPIEPGELTIEATVDVTFALDARGAAGNAD